jgi:D-glycero-D-manno-heptose 1,7-bisphosphate phosphatase
MQKAIFLDRDGVLNKEIGQYVTNVQDLEILPHVLHNLTLLRDAGFIFVVITNQGGIAKGLYTHDALISINNKLTQTLAHNGIKLTDIYYCPHHTDFGKCICRKPQSVLLEKALSKYKIKPQKSWMIGDNERDILAAQKVGLNARLIPSNQDWIAVVHEILSVI